MSQNCNYGCASLPAHQQVTCNDYAVGGISAAALIECDQTTITDYTNATQWNAALASGVAKLILDIKGEIPAASPVLVDNPVGCGAQQIVTGMDNTAIWTDANVIGGNDDLYAKLNLRKMYLVLFMCEEGQIRVSESPVDFQAVPVVVPNNSRAMQMYNVTASFFTKTGEIPFQLYSAPSGIFN